MMTRNGRMWSGLVVRLKSIAAVSLNKLQSFDGLLREFGEKTSLVKKSPSKSELVLSVDHCFSLYMIAFTVSKAKLTVFIIDSL